MLTAVKKRLEMQSKFFTDQWKTSPAMTPTGKKKLNLCETSKLHPSCRVLIQPHAEVET